MFPSNIVMTTIVLFGAGEDDPDQPGPTQPESDLYQEGAFGVSYVINPLILGNTDAL